MMPSREWCSGEFYATGCAVLHQAHQAGEGQAYRRQRPLDDGQAFAVDEGSRVSASMFRARENAMLPG